MRFRIHILIALTVTAAAMILTSCEGTHVRYSQKGTTVENTNPTHQHGPPPHAPAHGYRHKHPDGVDLVYKQEISAYVVLGYTGVYFYKSSYYRERGDAWEVSVHIDGPWKVTSSKKVPKGLKKVKSHKH